VEIEKARYDLIINEVENVYKNNSVAEYLNNNEMSK
jgi:hypothetical protein